LPFFTTRDKCCGQSAEESAMDNDQNPKNSPKVKLNCWDVMMCGREQGGKNADEFGVDVDWADNQEL